MAVPIPKESPEDPLKRRERLEKEIQARKDHPLLLANMLTLYMAERKPALAKIASHVDTARILTLLEGLRTAVLAADPFVDPPDSRVIFGLHRPLGQAHRENFPAFELALGVEFLQNVITPRPETAALIAQAHHLTPDDDISGPLVIGRLGTTVHPINGVIYYRFQTTEAVYEGLILDIKLNPDTSCCPLPRL